MVTAYFLDSSALLKRYVSETGTFWIQSLTAQEAGNLLIVARIAWVEILSALASIGAMYSTSILWGKHNDIHISHC